VNREEATGKLSEYVLGQLDPATAAEMAEYLAGDDELERSEEFLRWLLPCLREMKGHLPGPHPTGEELVQVVTGEGQFVNQREDWVREHLASCAECRQLAAQVRATDRGLRQADQPGLWRRLNQQTRLGLAAVLALIILSSSLWFGPFRNVPENSQIPTVHLAGLTRDAVATVEVRPTDSNELPPLMLECDPWIGRMTADDFRLEIRLWQRETHEVVTIWRVNAQAVWSADQGGILLVPNSPAPTPGHYDLEVRDELGAVIFQTGFLLLPR
jgi:hypothetical protein